MKPAVRITLLVLLFLTGWFVGHSAHAEDVLEIQVGGTVTRFTGVLIDRTENGDDGSIEFGARRADVVPVGPSARARPRLAGDYDVEVIPHDGSVEGFRAEHCLRGAARFVHVSSSTYMRLVCAVEG